MQHLDDALIAEWVDGAIAEGSPQYTTIAAHVEQCDECRARVDEERALAAHVRELLGVAAPPDPIPAFDEVLHRAGRRRPAGLAPAWRRLAWAATLVVAGGVGWYGRGLMHPTDRTAQAPAAAGKAADRSPSPAAEPPAVDQVEAPRAEAAVTRDAPAEETRQVSDERARPAAPAVQPPLADAIAGRRQENENAVTDSVPAAPAARRDAARSLAAEAVGGVTSAPVQPSAHEAAAQPARMQKVAATITWTAVPRPVAERVLGGPLRTIPDLPVTGVEVAPDGATVRVVQDLGGGISLDLIETAAPSGAPDAVSRLQGQERQRAAEGSVAEGSVVIAGVQVTARAPVSRDSLVALLARLR